MRASFASRVLGVVLLSASAAFAQDPRPYPDCTTQPTDGDVAAAKGAFQAGQASFNEADYNRAITYWEDAYRRDCTAHALLLNLARAYELNGQKKHAVLSLETYLARNPGSPQRDQIARRIEVLNEKIAAESSSPTPPPGTGTGTQAGNPDGPAKPPTTGEQPTEAKRNKLPLYIAIGGGALFVIGGLGYLSATGDVKDAEDQCGGRNSCPADVAQAGNDARDRQTSSGAVAAIGLVVGAGGTIWYLMSAPKSDAPSAALRPAKPMVAPAVAPGYAGLQLSGAF